MFGYLSLINHFPNIFGYPVLNDKEEDVVAEEGIEKEQKDLIDKDPEKTDQDDITLEQIELLVIFALKNLAKKLEKQRLDLRWSIKVIPLLAQRSFPFKGTRALDLIIKQEIEDRLRMILIEQKHLSIKHIQLIKKKQEINIIINQGIVK